MRAGQEVVMPTKRYSAEQIVRSCTP